MFFDDNLTMFSDEKIMYLLSNSSKFTVHRNPFYGIIFDVKGIFEGINSLEVAFVVNAGKVETCDVATNQIYRYVSNYLFFELFDKDKTQMLLMGAQQLYDKFYDEYENIRSEWKQPIPDTRYESSNLE